MRYLGLPLLLGAATAGAQVTPGPFSATVTLTIEYN